MSDALQSWNDTPTRQAIVEFVESVTREGSPHYLAIHDDPQREFDYTAGAEQSLERAEDEGWTVVSIKNDWATVFADIGR